LIAEREVHAMPRKNDTKVPQKAIDKAIARHLAGESSLSLAKEYKVSRATFYLWVAKYKQQLLETNARKDMTPKEQEQTDKRTLIVQLQQLKLENTRLKNKVVAMMLKAGEI
jgi:transposase-like protein